MFLRTFLALLIISLLAIRCQNINDKEGFTNDPKLVAKLSHQIANIGNNEEKLKRLYKKHGYNLSSGAKKYNQIYDEILADPEKYKIFQKELLKLIQKHTNLPVEESKKK